MGIPCTKHGTRVVDSSRFKMRQSFNDGTDEDNDSRLPLTTSEKYNVKRFWKQICRHMTETGVSTFINVVCASVGNRVEPGSVISICHVISASALVFSNNKCVLENAKKHGMFEMNSDVLTMFQKQIGSSENIEQLRSNKILEGHVLMVMHTLDEAFSNLNDLDFVIEMLHSVGRTHKKMPSFAADIFWKIQEPFLLAVQETLGDRYTAGVEKIYQMTIDFILKELGEGIKGVGLV